MCHWQLREAPDVSSLSDLRFPSATRHILALFASLSSTVENPQNSNDFSLSC
jgi:hypothetical protein